jgi:hypothetical protein
MIMKKVFLFLLVFSFCEVSFGQRSEEFQKYLNDSIYNSDNPNYIIWGNAISGKWQKTLYYSIKKGIPTLTINNADTVFADRALYKPNLFEIVKNNKTNIKSAIKYQIRKMLGTRNKFTDSGFVYIQLSIKYEDLHFNHLQKFTEEEINKKKNKKFKEGMLIINKLYAILEEAEKQ